jgi:hypothetical protein
MWEYEFEIKLADKARKLGLDPMDPKAEVTKNAYLAMLSNRGLGMGEFEHLFGLAKKAHNALLLPFQSEASTLVSEFTRL